MSFRARLLVAFTVIALAPIVGLSLMVRREMDQRLTAQYQMRVRGLTAVTAADLAAAGATVGSALASLRESAADDDRLRAAVVHGEDRAYLLDYAGRAMRLAGLAMLQVQDDDGRILSSGHFRNEYDRLEPDLPRLLAAAPGGAALVDARTPEGPRRVLARVDSVRLAGRRFTLVGGLAVDSGFLGRLATDSTLTVSLVVPGARVGDNAVASLPFAFIGPDSGTRQLQTAQFVVTHPTTELEALRASVDQWFIVAVALAALAAVLVAVSVAARVGRPLAELAAKTERLDLDRLDVAFATNRQDEIGTLARLLDALTRRLRSSAVRLRDAERRATIGDLARQVNHDVKNGLAPMRHVLRHLDQVARDEPARLGEVFAERRGTLEAGVEYLDSLARNYARLTPRMDVRPVDINAIVRSVSASERIVLQLDPRLATMTVDALAVRRILDNLVANALDALVVEAGIVTIATKALPGGGARLTVADTGCGMTDEQLDRAFDDFYTTKPQGTGLGLSIVRRLVADLGAALAIDTAPGQGTRVTITFS